jgi:FAD synthetase
MKAESLVKRYLRNAEDAFRQIDENADRPSADATRVLNHAKRYFEDATYYHHQKILETALTSVAYCEGLLDALRILGMVEFEWTTVNKSEQNVG